MERAASLWRDRATVTCVCLFTFGWGATQLPLFDLDEGAFAQATLEMLARGDWLTTWLNAEPRYDKPILTYWLQAVCVQILGPTEVAFRLPSILAATAWALATQAFCRTYAGGRVAGLFAGIALPTALIVSVTGRAATADALLNLWLALTFFDFFRWSQAQDGHSRWPLLARVYLWLGLGVLTKGPVAIAIPLLAGVVACAVLGRWREFGRAATDPLGWLILVVTVGIWVLPLALRGDLAFIGQFLLEHNVRRALIPAESHRGPIWFYLLWLPLVLMPLPALLPGVARLARSARSDFLVLLALSWFTVVLVAFSLMATKLPHYILYGCTPLVVLMARDVAALPPRRAPLLLAPGVLLLAVFAMLPVLLPLLIESAGSEFERGMLELASASIGFAYVGITLAALAAAMVLAGMRRPPWQTLAGMGLIQAVAVWLAVAPVVANAQQGPVREAARLARQLGEPVVSYRTALPSFSVYRGAITPNRAPEPGELVFLRRDRIPRLRAAQPDALFVLVYQRGGVALLRRLSSTPAHAASGS
ncbi:MAG: ArnT family glycosyltransferase [Porticoccaceae bacterium]